MKNLKYLYPREILQLVLSGILNSEILTQHRNHYCGCALDHIFWPSGRMSSRQFVYYSSLWMLILARFFPGCLFSLQIFSFIYSRITPESLAHHISQQLFLSFSFPDALPPSQYADTQSSDALTDSSQTFQQGSSTSKSQTSYRPMIQTGHYPQDVQSDQLQRGVFLGPPGSPQGVKSVFQDQKDDRLKKLEKRMEELV